VEDWSTGLICAGSEAVLLEPVVGCLDPIGICCKVSFSSLWAFVSP
jgi:hypothetical protein